MSEGGDRQQPEGNPARALELAREHAVGLDVAAANGLPPALLAYVGDAVYELHARMELLVPPKRIRNYHQAVVDRVRAESQAALLERWLPLLSPAECDLVRRGRNAATRAPKRLSPAIYQQATGFEALIGYLFLNDPNRLYQLLSATAEEPPPP